MKTYSSSTKISPSSSVEYFFYDGVKETLSEGMNHISAVDDGMTTSSLKNDYRDEEIPLRQLACFQNDEEAFMVIR